MKANYKNWVPTALVRFFLRSSLLCLAGFIIFGFITSKPSGNAKIVLMVLFGTAFLLITAALIWSLLARRAFDFYGKRKMSLQILEGIADYVTLPEGGLGLDIGCGSGALTIVCAKKNPQGTMYGLDLWGKEPSLYNQKVCEKNAEIEGVKNIRFIQGDAREIDFPDETFDAVCSNYVYHNIEHPDMEFLLLETLRVLKKGGTFAIHDIMKPKNYGDISRLTARLKKQGIEEIRWIDTTQNVFMTPREAKTLLLSGSGLLLGRK